MNEARELFSRCQGGMSEAEYAARLGVTCSYVQKMKDGRRAVSGRILIELARMFPRVKREVVALLFEPGQRAEIDQVMAISKEA